MKPGVTRGWRRTVGENAVCKAGGEFERSCAERIASPRAIRVPRDSLSLFHPLLSPSSYLSIYSPLSNTRTHTYTHNRAQYIHIRGSFGSGGRATICTHTHATYTHPHIHMLSSQLAVCTTRTETHMYTVALYSLCLPRDSYPYLHTCWYMSV